MAKYKKRSLDELKKMIAEDGTPAVEEDEDTTIKKIKKAVEKESPDKASAIFKAAKEAVESAKKEAKPRKTEIKEDEIITLKKAKHPKTTSFKVLSASKGKYSFKTSKDVEAAVLDVIKKAGTLKIPGIIKAVLENATEVPKGVYTKGVKKGVPKAAKMIQWAIWKAYEEGKLERIGFGTYSIGEGKPHTTKGGYKRGIRAIEPKLRIEPKIEVEMPTVTAVTRPPEDGAIPPTADTTLKPEAVVAAKEGKFEPTGTEDAETVADEDSGEVIGDAGLFLKKAPDNYYPEKDLVTTYEAMYSHPNYPPLMLVGPPGAGKTTSVEDFVFKKNVPYITIQANRDTTDMELIGHEGLKSDGHGGAITQFEPGELPRAISAANKYGTAVLLVDEINALQPEYQLAFNSLLDGRRAVFGAKRKWALKPGANLIIIGTMNPEGYAGTNPINDVLRSRFTFMDVEYPNSKVEAKIMSEYCKDTKLMTKLLQLADASRAKEAGKNIYDYPLSPRDLKYVLKVYDAHRDVGLTKEEALRTALKQCVLKKYVEPNQEAAMKRYIYSLFGKMISPDEGESPSEDVEEETKEVEDE